MYRKRFKAAPVHADLVNMPEVVVTSLKRGMIRRILGTYWMKIKVFNKSFVIAETEPFNDDFTIMTTI